MGCAPSLEQHSPALMVYCTKNVCTGSDSPPPAAPPTPARVQGGRSSLSQTEVAVNGKDRDILTGRVKMRSGRMNILLVFSKEDAQCDAFRWAAERGSYKCTVCRSAENALESYVETQHDLIIIDCRHSKSFDYESLCRSMRAVSPKNQSLFIAVMKKCNDKEESSIAPLLIAGFHRRFIESTNVGTCLNELISIERGELKTLQAVNAMLIALQNIPEAIEIMDRNLRTEFVNSAFERYSGYSSTEVVGLEIQKRLEVDNCNEEDTIIYHMNKGQVWDGTQSFRKKNGDTVMCKCKVIPVESSPGNVQRHIVIRSPIHDSHPTWDKMKEERIGLMHIKRRESFTKIHSMTIEAPITKVINIINEAQANSPMTVVQALDRVLDILQTTELFSPHIQKVKEEDPLTNDYVGGLCDQSGVGGGRFLSNRQNLQKLGTSLRLQLIQQPPVEVQKLLENDASWEFDIIKMESLTNRQVLVPLGMKIFTRFGALDFLGVDELTLANWLQVIGENYHANNTYHNATHAADVLQATAYFLDRMRAKKILDTADEVAALVAAVIHDVDHPGKTSSFLVNSRDKLALLYNDIAVLENHHAATGFLLTVKDDKSNIFRNLDREEYESLRHNVVDMVLATEMAKHFEHLQKFIHICKAHLKCTEEDASIKSCVTSVSDVVINSPENRRQILRMAIKCADVSNPARMLPLCKEWATRIAEEYFLQTDEERAKKLPVVMPNFDRATCQIPHSQLRFIEVFLLNMFENWAAFLDIPELVAMLQSNYKYWQEMEEQHRQQQQRLVAVGKGEGPPN